MAKLSVTGSCMSMTTASSSLVTAEEEKGRESERRVICGAVQTCVLHCREEKDRTVPLLSAPKASRPAKRHIPYT